MRFRKIILNPVDVASTEQELLTIVEYVRAVEAIDKVSCRHLTEYLVKWDVVYRASEHNGRRSFSKAAHLWLKYSAMELMYSSQDNGSTMVFCATMALKSRECIPRPWGLMAQPLWLSLEFPLCYGAVESLIQAGASPNEQNRHLVTCQNQDAGSRGGEGNFNTGASVEEVFLVAFVNESWGNAGLRKLNKKFYGFWAAFFKLMIDDGRADPNVSIQLDYLQGI